jgi:hypothetical protein
MPSDGATTLSLSLGRDGLLIGYFETDDLQTSPDGMAATDLNAKW